MHIRFPIPSLHDSQKEDTGTGHIALPDRASRESSQQPVTRGWKRFYNLLFPIKITRI